MRDISSEEPSSTSQEPDEREEGADGFAPRAPSARRTRVAVALGASILLAAIVGIVVATGGSEDPPPMPTGTCFEAWNDDAIAPVQDGQHAYAFHGYRQTLVSRVDEAAQVIESPDEDAAPDDPQARCVVVFASPQVDMEPDFGVRVFDKGRWTGLALSDKVPVEEIAGLQADAVAVSNALLIADGRLAND